MNEFIKRYKKLSTSKLLKILQNPEDYQAEAIKSAAAELTNRGLEKEEIEAAKNIIQLAEDTKLAKQAKVHQIENKGQELIEFWNAIKYQKPNLRLKITGIAILFTILTILSTLKDIEFYQYMMTQKIEEWDISTFLIVFQTLLLLSTCFLFWKRNRIGWILLTALTIIGIFQSLSVLIFAINYSSTQFPIVDEFLINPALGIFVFVILFFGIMLWTMCKPDFFAAFKISKNAASLTLIISVVLGLILTLA